MNFLKKLFTKKKKPFNRKEFFSSVMKPSTTEDVKVESRNNSSLDFLTFNTINNIITNDAIISSDVIEHHNTHYNHDNSNDTNTFYDNNTHHNHDNSNNYNSNNDFDTGSSYSSDSTSTNNDW